MNPRHLEGRYRRLAALVGLTGALLAAGGGNAMAQSHDGASDNGPVGPWAIQVTLRDCASGAPLGPAFNSLVTFHRGGTLTESAGGVAFAPGQRSTGHGTWTHAGNRTYVQRMVAMLLFATAPNVPNTATFNPALPVTPGFFTGSATVTHRFVLSDPDHATSSGTNEFYRADGTLYRTGCSTAVAQRFQ
jgi:hypothetical protein